MFLGNDFFRNRFFPANRLRSNPLRFEILERRALMASDISISDAMAIEGTTSLQFVDEFIGDNTGELVGPRQLLFGPDGNNDGVADLYIPSRWTNEVLRYDARTGTLIDAVISGDSRLNAPWAAVFGPDGNLYVGGSLSDNVLRYNFATGQTEEYIAPASGGLHMPKGLAFDVAGNLYVTSLQNETGGFNQVLRYQGPAGVQPGQFIDVFVDHGSGGLDKPHGIAFGPDGNLYVTSHTTDSVNRYAATDGHFIDIFVPAQSGGVDGPNYVVFRPDGLYVTSQLNHAVLRYDSMTGASLAAAVQTTGADNHPSGLAFDTAGMMYVSVNTSDRSSVLRYGAASRAFFTVTLGSPTDSTVSVNYATTNGTAVAGSDYVTTSGTLTFAPGQTKQTILVQTVDDSSIELNETFSIVLSDAVGAVIADDTGVATISDNDTKFYVVNDGGTSSADRTFEYGIGSDAGEAYVLTTGNAAPRGAASTAAGDKVWVVDANKKVYVYSNSGALLGSWTAGSLASNATVEGIATNGTDIWIVDAKQDRVYRYTGAASRLSGSQNAASNFALNSGNRDPKDIVTDGVHLWVVNNSTTDKVFKYTLSGALVGSWTINSGGGSPTGITIDPASVSDIWIVDNATDRVYQFYAAARTASGSEAPDNSFPLAAGNTNPQGIADPPAGGAAASATAASNTARNHHRVSVGARRDAIDYLFADNDEAMSHRARRVRRATHALVGT